MTSVTPGYLVHDINARSSTRVHAQPGGNSSLGNILGDPNAKFDDGRVSNKAPAQSSSASAAHNNRNVATAAMNKHANLSSSIFDTDRLNQAVPVQGRGGVGRSSQNKSDIFSTEPVASSVRVQSHGAARQNTSNIFSSNDQSRAPMQSRAQPAGAPAPAPAAAAAAHASRNIIGAGYATAAHDDGRTAAPVRTSVRVRAPPGGKSSFTIG